MNNSFKIPKGAYDPMKNEPEILAYWKENEFFRAEYHPEKGVQSLEELKIDSREAFCIVNPPPNANGRPHIGHMSGYAYQDLMARYARMQGKKVAMIPGKDHAGIQTESVFERDVLKPKGKTKMDLGRESFYRATYEFCEKASKWARDDEERIGLSSDFSKDTFTLDPEIVTIVLNTFKRMVEDGLVYRGIRLINWCPSCQTALADIDTEKKERESKLYYIKYPLKDKVGEFIEVATTRPETMLGDTAVVVHPTDRRYTQLLKDDAKVVLPLTDREVPIITNPRIEKEFGTGALKLTPAHAPEDYAIMEEWNRENPDSKVGYINVIDKNSKMVGPVGDYFGLSVDEAREKVVQDLEKMGLITKVEKLDQTVAVCERCKSIIEPIISGQWYADVAKLKQPAIDCVKNGEVKIHPDYMKKRYLNWMENLREWPISRSLWWGYRIPVWYKGGKSEWIDENGIVREKIGEYEVADSDNPAKTLTDLQEKELIYVGLDDPNLPRLFVIPGKHGYIHREETQNIFNYYGSGTKVTVNNIDNPSYEDYELAFKNTNFDETSVVVTHSLGCLAFIKYALEHDVKVGKLIMIAPGVRPRKKDEQSKYASVWGNSDKFNQLKIGEIKVIYSDNDELGPIEAFEEFVSKFNDAEAVLEPNQGHYYALGYSHKSEELYKTLDQIKQNQTSTWIQDEDVFDTWFSSGQWAYAPLIKHGLIETFYPSSVMETMFDILELWVSRMIMLGIYHEGQIPFTDVYLHGMVMAADGQKMSKSKGNQVAPEEVINKYGADVLRLFYYTRGKAGGQYAVDYENMVGNGKFLNKMWNSAKFVMMNIADSEISLSTLDPKNLKLEVEDKELIKELKELSKDTHRRVQAFNFSVASQGVYDAFWHSFCDGYIEKVKTRLYTKDRDGNPLEYDKDSRLAAQWSLYHGLDTYLKLLHPFVPFITDKLWLLLGECIGEDTNGKSVVWERFNY
ncbi:class I tRNA ligase family protein [Candidatus Dojkabacteria bacterium]|uniref:valine--tRNA ligase n=1 Tax=Candidatus Dojkabacteria bacterium TaxID=2099670 RepID=A0A955L2R9_9BACT|nr:class I tRNA ligase family protein [Candidatus Dojkabacteria bacterium]